MRKIKIYPTQLFKKKNIKTHILPLKFQYVTSFYHIFKNKHNHTQLILIPIIQSKKKKNSNTHK